MLTAMIFTLAVLAVCLYLIGLGVHALFGIIQTLHERERFRRALERAGL